MSHLERLAKLALMVWAVSTWVVGYVFAPLMFAHFDKWQAGLNTGELLNTTYVMSLVCGLILLVEARCRHGGHLLHHTDLWLTLGALFIVIVQYVGISPKMLLLKQTMRENPDATAQFMRLHGVSQVLYLGTAILLAVLVWRQLLSSNSSNTR